MFKNNPKLHQSETYESQTLTEVLIFNDKKNPTFKPNNLKSTIEINKS